MPELRRTLFILLLLLPYASAQEVHSHPVPERLGKVSFAISCRPDVQDEFNRGVALIHSFTYSAARVAFEGVVKKDPKCAMAHWGIALSYFRQLWDPPLVPATLSMGLTEIQSAQDMAAGTVRERQLIEALALVFKNADTVSYRERASNYERAMSDIAAKNRDDVEAQVFCALALLANASPADKTHAKQKQAADLLEPLDRLYPEHPGIPHYLIHAYDNAELARRGLPAARAYSQIASSAPHALHMPSHIFTRLGLWDDSINANLAARKAAKLEGDVGEELHSMDYLVYAYLQAGRPTEAAQIVQQTKNIPVQNGADFKSYYASTAMPVRYAMERQQWTDAAAIVPPTGAPPHVTAIAEWARGMGLARSGHPEEARRELAQLQKLEEQLHAAGNEYWAAQTRILVREVEAWSNEAEHKSEEAVRVMSQAAADEDAIEKLPVTPGPIVPAREQLGYLLLQQNRPELARKEFETALANSPGRRGAVQGAQAAELKTAK
jgi:hypothetical protein